MPTLHSLTFDISGLRSVSDEPTTPNPRAVWMSPDGDGLSLNYFPKPPDFPANLPSLPAIGQFYQRVLQNSPTRLVSVRITTVDACRSVELILKAPQKPTGFTYVGSLTLPFRDFSFVLKVQCEERGTTGIRETILLERLLKSGQAAPAPGSLIPENFYPDDPQYDQDFPTHPITRLRKLLRHLESTARLDDNTRQQPAFPLPS